MTALIGAVTTALMVSAMPATAASVITGEGALTGWEYPTDSNPPQNCIEPIPLIGFIGGDRFVMNSAVATYQGVNTVGTPIALYVGPVTVEITVGEHVISPAGVSPACLPHPFPVPLVTATVTGASGTGTVNCTMTASPANIYTRATSAVNFTFLSDCTIKGNTAPLSATVHANPTLHTITGTMNPCELPPLFLPNPECGVLFPLPPPPDDEPGSHLIVTLAAAGVTAP